RTQRDANCLSERGANYGHGRAGRRIDRGVADDGVVQPSRLAQIIEQGPITVGREGSGFYNIAGYGYDGRWPGDGGDGDLGIMDHAARGKPLGKIDFQLLYS